MRAFFGIGVRMRISEKAVRPQTKGRRSMPVAAGNESSGGEANSVTPFIYSKDMIYKKLRRL